MTKAADSSPLPQVPEGLFKDVKYYIVGAVQENVRAVINNCILLTICYPRPTLGNLNFGLVFTTVSMSM